MIEEGALDSVHAAIALHTRKVPAGRIGVTEGPAFAGNDTIRIVVAAGRRMPHIPRKASTLSWRRRISFLRSSRSYRAELGPACRQSSASRPSTAGSRRT